MAEWKKKGMPDARNSGCGSVRREGPNTVVVRAVPTGILARSLRLERTAWHHRDGRLHADVVARRCARFGGAVDLDGAPGTAGFEAAASARALDVLVVDAAERPGPE
jgi:hypothetical protein